VEATDEKRFREEFVPVPVKTRKGETIVEADEGPGATPPLRSLPSSSRLSKKAAW
jgi:hypothetical protein